MVPQRPYNAIGTLGEQLTYPETPDLSDPAAVAQLVTPAVLLLFVCGISDPAAVAQLVTPAVLSLFVFGISDVFGRKEGAARVLDFPGGGRGGGGGEEEAVWHARALFVPWLHSSGADWCLQSDSATAIPPSSGRAAGPGRVVIPGGAREGVRQRMASFWTKSHAFLSSVPPNTRRLMTLPGAHACWALAARCLRTRRLTYPA